ncbi:MAG TPA: TIGR03986 family CRISPR-associated RAMP protein, partial [Campylobacterales bacterium]|nr:TIGR03986 family CRISPR-associated RAMP protein [Campylobacterales bacterium]
AKSPIFVRDSINKEKFCNHNDTPYIPSTSVKGMIRSVLEIMSFSKMSMFNDNTYAVRDMSDSRNFYMSKMKPKNTFCGWLKKVNNTYVIKDCGIPGRIRQDNISQSFASHFRSDIFNEKEEYFKTAKYKYSMLEDIKLPVSFSHKKNHNGKEIYIVGTQKSGKVVLTGQSSGRKEGKNANGKIYEFIFFESNKKTLTLDEEVFENFKFAYFDGRKTQPTESIDWGFWKEKLENGEDVPVFFQKDNNGKVEHFGLSYLYKLPYKYSIKNAIESISKEHFDKRSDLAQTIFGFVDSEEKKALKGRVQFSHFKVDSKPKPFKTITTVLGTPRASYYPIYMNQDCRKNGTIETANYNTLMDKKTEIRGRKRYPLQQKVPNPKKYSQDEDSSTTFQPLGTYDKKSGDFNEFTFSGKLRYHNLKKEELGAILSALTFHGNSSEFYHNIGMAKSYGFGKILIDIDMKGETQIELLQAYERMMVENIGNNWLESEPLKELFSMASKELNIDSRLKYLTLDPTKQKDDFREMKNNKSCLPLVSQLPTVITKYPASLFDNETITSFSMKEDKKNEFLKECKEKQKILEETPDSFSKAFKDAIEKYVTNKIDLPYYDYGHLKMVFEKRENEIVSDDIYNAYCELIDDKSFESIEPLLAKREKNKATDLELAELYNLLIKGLDIA